jgi:hypothetical protein
LTRRVLTAPGRGRRCHHPVRSGGVARSLRRSRGQRTRRGRRSHGERSPPFGALEASPMERECRPPRALGSESRRPPGRDLDRTRGDHEGLRGTRLGAVLNQAAGVVETIHKAEHARGLVNRRYTPRAQFCGGHWRERYCAPGTRPAIEIFAAAISRQRSSGKILPITATCPPQRVLIHGFIHSTRRPCVREPWPTMCSGSGLMTVGRGGGRGSVTFTARAVGARAGTTRPPNSARWA